MDNTVSEDQITKFLAVVNAELEAHKKFMQLHAPTLAPEFNCFNYLYPNENRLSNVLAKLLDPNGGHGQGAHFLKMFLEEISKKYPDKGPLKSIIELSGDDLKNCVATPEVEVQTSYIKSDQRRIDILIHFSASGPKGFGLAIENKPWDRDQSTQIKDYNEHLKKQYGEKNYTQIYLSGRGEPPKEISISEEDRQKLEEQGVFHIFTYSELHDWCSRCVEKCQSHRLRCFLEDFASYIKEQFKGELPMANEDIVVSNAIKDENLLAAVSVVFSSKAIKIELMKKLTRLVLKTAGIGEDWKCVPDFNDEKDTGFSFIKQGWSKYKIAFRFDSNNANGFCYGIVKSSEDSSIYNSDVFCFDRLEKGKSSDWWPWFQEFRGDYWNWGNSQVPWLGIKEGGETVKLVSEKLKMLIEKFEKQIDKNEGLINSQAEH